MSDRRYEVYEVCKHGSVAPHEGWPLHAQVWGDYVTCDGGTRLDFIPDALVEEAADAIDALGFDTLELRNWGDDSVANATELVARAALSVLFPGHDRNDE